MGFVLDKSLRAAIERFTIENGSNPKGAAALYPFTFSQCQEMISIRTLMMPALNDKRLA